MTYWIFEMANNHQGDIDHAKEIIEEFAKIKEDYNISAGIKFQFRQLETFLHSSIRNSDLKYAKRFRETELSSEQFKVLTDYASSLGLDVIATPFDNESISMINELNVDIVKVASCSIDDWPLLKELSKLNRSFVVSTAGASLDTLTTVYNLFKDAGASFSFMHCVGEYPTDYSCANLNRIDELKNTFHDIEIGISTHESPHAISIVPLAIAKGCKIVEKHVGLNSNGYTLNGYSCTPDDIRDLLDKVKFTETALTGASSQQVKTLQKLKRGVYVRKNLSKGHILKNDDVYYAMPLLEKHVSVSNIDNFIGCKLDRDIQIDSPLPVWDVSEQNRKKTIMRIKDWAHSFADYHDIVLNENTDKFEISCHYGIDDFEQHGAFIVTKVNREYCKKLIFVMGGQSHPVHHHLIKEEAFELLKGDCTLYLNGKKINMRPGKPYIISRGVDHGFSSAHGAIIEEISTKHIVGDSVYKDNEILKKSTEDRKIYL